MVYKTGTWGEQAKLYSQKRKQYFRDRQRKLYKRKNIGISDVKFGRFGELRALEILNNAIDKNKDTVFSYDIEWNDKKIDVKTSHYKFRKNRLGKKDGKIIGSWSWKFFLKQRGEVDFFILVCLEDNEIKYIFLVPDEEFGNIKYLSLTKTSIPRFLKFLIK